MSNANNPINNTVGASISGVTNTLTVTNPSNTASSAARETITVGGGSAADPTLNFNVNAVTDWEMGIDNSVNDNLTISQSTALGTKDTWRMTTAGQRTMPLQPAFFAYLSANANNVTGDATQYQPKFDTVRFDQSANYDNINGVFTAPVTGKYYLATSLNITNINAGHTSFLIGITVNGINYRIMEDNASHDASGSGSAGFTGSFIIDMVAGQTANCTLEVQGGTKTISLRGISGAVQLSYFSGFLVC